jgi:hypothetical protein
MLQHGLEGLLSCFYPADDLRVSGDLAYYRQREWRIAWNFTYNGEEVMRKPSSELIDHLLGIDRDFFGKDFISNAGKRRLAEEALVYPAMGDSKVITLARRVIVPRAALAQAAGIISKFAPDVPLVCIEDLPVA